MAKGTAFYLCSGERKDGKGAYSESSFFGSIEIPAMNTALATKLVDQVVVLVVSRGHRYGEYTIIVSYNNGQACSSK